MFYLFIYFYLNNYNILYTTISSFFQFWCSLFITHVYDDTNISEMVHSVFVHLHFKNPLEIGRMSILSFLKCLKEAEVYDDQVMGMSQYTTNTIVIKSKAFFQTPPNSY